MARLRLDRALVAHAHPQSHLLLHAGGPATRFAIGARILLLDSTHGVFVGPWEPHDYPHPADLPPLDVLALYLEPHWLAARLPASGAQVSGCSLAIGAAAKQSIDGLLRVLEEPGIFDLDDQAILELLATLEPDEDVSPCRCSGLMLEGEIDRRLRKTLTLLREQVGARPDFAELAQHAGLSRPHFFELFRRELHLTPQLYWNVLRMERALKDVADPRIALSAVSADLGFTAQSNFTRFFRDIQGVAPQEYRRLMASAVPPPRARPAVAALRFF